MIRHHLICYNPQEYRLSVASHVMHPFVLCSQLPKKLAPTGSGKTALFELGLIRMLGDNKRPGNAFKCVYVAPTKVAEQEYDICLRQY